VDLSVDPWLIEDGSLRIFKIFFFSVDAHSIKDVALGLHTKT
jgi:hypothetical protein